MALIAMYVVSCDCCWRPAVMPEDAALSALESHVIAESLGWRLGDQGDRCPSCVAHRKPCADQPVERLAG